MNEYAGFQNLLQCGLCDTINVVFPDYNSSGAFKIVQTVWNVLNDKYDSMELGDLSVSLSEALGIDSFGSESKREPIISASPTITRTSGGTITYVDYKRTGNVAMLYITLQNSSSVASGANVFVGTLEDGYRPVTHARGCGYYGAHSIIGQIGSDGAIIIRNASSTAVTLSSNVGLTFTYIIE